MSDAVEGIIKQCYNQQHDYDEDYHYNTMTRPKPVLLLIFDGWGYREDPTYNAIAAANTPCWDRLQANYAHTLISASGYDVGLPDQQMGNSEVGHMNLGAGRVVYQELTRIDKAISDGTFFENSTLVSACKVCHNNQKALHIMGLLSPGGVHSHESHILALMTLAKQQGISKIYLHAFLDGRDTPPQSALASITAVENHCKGLDAGQIASLVGRYYAMDRDNRWERVEKAYDLLTSGQANFHAATASEGLAMAYERGETDEFVQPTAIHAANMPVIKIEDGDTVVFMNFRADRARQLTRAFLTPDFSHFARKVVPSLTAFLSLTPYASDISTTVIFKPDSLHNGLGEYISHLGLKQLRISETEKYAHVTFFFNGGREQPFPGEDRILVPSPKVATYDLQPEMSASEVTEKLIEAIKSQQYDFMVCNFANADMVGHTGNFQATVTAIETLDHCLDKIVQALLAVGGEALITADHGNAEKMFDPITQQAHTAHTSDKIPLVYVGRGAEFIKKDGILADVAPTLLYIMDITPPKEMQGQELLKFN